MRICLVCHEASLTGAPRIGFDIAAHLADVHDVTVFVKMGGALIDFPKYERLRSSCRVLDTHHELCDHTYGQRMEQAAAALRDNKPDLLYVNSVAAGEWCEAGRIVGVPVVLHTHETSDSLPFLLSAVCTPKILQFTDLLVGASRRAMDDIETLTETTATARLNLGIFLDTEAVLADAERPAPPPRDMSDRPLSTDGGRRVVAMCGMAQPRKGPEVFLEVAKRLPNCDFVWIGPWAPPETTVNEPAYERAKSLRLSNFFCTGLTDNPYAHLRQADAFLLTAHEDPNPLAVAEAVLLGCKTVAFSATGASASMLARCGYALSGVPDAAWAASVLPKVLESDAGPWQRAAADEVRERLASATKLNLLQETLERLASQPTAAAGKPRNGTR